MLNPFQILETLRYHLLRARLHSAYRHHFRFLAKVTLSHSCNIEPDGTPSRGRGESSFEITAWDWPEMDAIVEKVLLAYHAASNDDERDLLEHALFYGTQDESKFNDPMFHASDPEWPQKCIRYGIDGIRRNNRIGHKFQDRLVDLVIAAKTLRHRLNRFWFGFLNLPEPGSQGPNAEDSVLRAHIYRTIAEWHVSLYADDELDTRPLSRRLLEEARAAKCRMRYDFKNFPRRIYRNVVSAYASNGPETLRTTFSSGFGGGFRDEYSGRVVAHQGKTVSLFSGPDLDFIVRRAVQ